MPMPSPIQATYSFNILDAGHFIEGFNGHGVSVGFYDIGPEFQPTGTNGFIDNNGSITSISAPGATTTVNWSINDRGDVVGFSASGPFGSDNQTLNLFEYSQGNFTPINVPNAIAVEPPLFINNSGVIVGSYEPPISQRIDLEGFIDNNGVFSTVRFPDAHFTDVLAQNVRGDIAGDYEISNVSAGFGYIYHNGSFTSLSYPGSTGTGVTAMNDVDAVVGVYGMATDQTQHAFIYANGKYTNIDVPGAILTDPTAINNQGAVVGSYEGFDSHGVLFEKGFVYDHGTFGNFDVPVPGAHAVSLKGINNSGEVFGNYVDSQGLGHSFTATPGGNGGVTNTTFDFSSVNPTTFAPPASGTILADTGASGGNGGLSSMSTSLLDPSLLVTPHIQT